VLTGYKHGLSGHKLYRVYLSIIQRCYNKNHKGYNLYGGRGIAVCDEWRNDFMAFYRWAMDSGYQHGLELDREENNSGYSPDNCRWATRSVNSQNTRTKKSNKCGYRGVWKDGGKWSVAIFNNGVRYWLGSHASKVAAALAFNRFVIENKTNHPLNIITIGDIINRENTENKSVSGYKGVRMEGKKWVAYIGINWGKVRIGIYETKEDAAIAYDRYIIENKLPRKLNLLLR
jgi:hypothetical protein